MLFDNFLVGLPTVPSFQTFKLKDINPLSGTQKTRLISNPNTAMRIIHQRLIRYLRSLDIKLPFAMGARPKNSPRRNVLWHSTNRFFWLLDLQNAYQSVDGEKLAKILCEVNPNFSCQDQDVLAFLTKYCLAPSRGLIIGAPASPDLFNIYAGVLIDRPLGDLRRRYGIRYTRYLDDLTFSSKVPIGKRKRRAVLKIVRGAGFAINHRKAKVYDLRKGPIVINGIGLKIGGRTFLPRHYARKIKGMLHRVETKGSVSSRKIHGLMGVFWSATDRVGLNKTEERVVRAYRDFHQQEIEVQKREGD